jgi:hypothetical protein
MIGISVEEEPKLHRSGSTSMNSSGRDSKNSAVDSPRPANSTEAEMLKSADVNSPTRATQGCDANESISSPVKLLESDFPWPRAASRVTGFERVI